MSVNGFGEAMRGAKADGAPEAPPDAPPETFSDYAPDWGQTGGSGAWWAVFSKELQARAPYFASDGYRRCPGVVDAARALYLHEMSPVSAATIIAMLDREPAVGE